MGLAGGREGSLFFPVGRFTPHPHPHPSRAYCSKKLRRLYRALRLTHGRGRYVKRKLDVGAGVTEVG